MLLGDMHFNIIEIIVFNTGERSKIGGKAAERTMGRTRRGARLYQKGSN